MKQKEKIAQLQKKPSHKKNISTGTKSIELQKEQKIVKNHLQKILNKINLENKSQKISLDIVSGTGHKTIALSQIFKKAYGIEPVKEEYEISKLKKSYFKKKNIKFIHGKAEKIDLPNNSVDFIYTETVLEHVENVNKTFSEMNRVLKKGGIIYLACPNYNWIYEGHYHMYMLPMMPKIYFRTIGRLFKQDYKFINHIKYITPKLVDKHIKKYGFKIINNFSEETIKNILIKQKYSTMPSNRKKLISLIKLINKIGLGKIIGNILIKKGFYPSIEITLTKK